MNISAIREAMDKRGLNRARLAEAAGVSRAAATKWLSGEDLPRPDKLLRIGLLLGLGFRELVQETADPLQPVVAFRKKGSRKTRDEHLDRARHMGMLLRKLVPHLPFKTLERPPTLRTPKTEYAYLQRVALEIRETIGFAQDSPLHYRDLVAQFKRLHAVVVPVLWGDRDHHENALHIYLPDSMTTWVYLNLDSTFHDFKFWMAHELGHVYAPELREDAGEDFADAFAQALLFPEACASAAYEEVKRGRSQGARVNKMKAIARVQGISPTTVNFALRHYAREHDLDRVDVGNAIHAATTNFNRDFSNVSKTLFTESPPSAKEYLAVAQGEFASPFFDALKALMRESSVSAGYVENVLQLPVCDAREILRELQ